jgi:hypothetical protein
MPVTLSVKKAVELLESGYVRWSKDEVVENQSLQRYFGLNTEQMKQLLKRPELKQKRTTDNNIIFEEDLVQTETTELVATTVVEEDRQVPGTVLVSTPEVSTTITESALFS